MSDESEWHLHVTVEPHWSWSFADVQKALQREIERNGMKIVVAKNVRSDGTVRKELLPTKHVHGDEASANREIFKMGVILNNAGWRVRRLKVEGDPRLPDVARRALYFEAHIKVPEDAVPLARERGFGISSTLRTPHYATVRSRDEDLVKKTCDDFLHEYYLQTRRLIGLPLHIEATTTDTNPQVDDDWLTMQ